MSKSNKEKERLRKIKLFEEGRIPFDVSMLKLKLVFFYTDGEHSNIKKNLLVSQQLKRKFKSYLANLIKTHLSNIGIYEFKIHMDILKVLSIINGISKKHVHSTISLFYKNRLLGEVYEHNENYLSYEPDEILFTETILEALLCNIQNIYKKMSIKNYLIDESKIKNTIFSNKKFKHFEFYKNINNFSTYLKRHNHSFKIDKYRIIYDLLNNCLSRISILSKSGEHFQEYNIAAPKTNLEILKMLSNIKYIKFDIENMSEEEIFEMYELLNY